MKIVLHPFQGHFSWAWALQIEILKRNIYGHQGQLEHGPQPESYWVDGEMITVLVS
jgi:hypothetical protein